MSEKQIRPVVLGVFRRGDSILVGEYDIHKGRPYYRPLGGGIDYGEHSRAALHREIREEISAEIKNVRLLATIENIFVYEGQVGHDIDQVYLAEFVDESLYERAEFQIVEPNEIGKAIWKPLADFQNGVAPLYPEGLLTLLLNSPSSTPASSNNTA